MKKDGILPILHISGLHIPVSIGVDELCTSDSMIILPSARRSMRSVCGSSYLINAHHFQITFLMTEFVRNIHTYIGVILSTSFSFLHFKLNKYEGNGLKQKQMGIDGMGCTTRSLVNTQVLAAGSTAQRCYATSHNNQ